MKANKNPRAGQDQKKNSNGGYSNDFYGIKLILDSGEEKNITALPVTIGRAQQNDIIIANKSVSNTHASLYFDMIINEVCIVDHESLNGILVDGYPTCRNILSDGNVVKLGKVSFTFRDTGYIHSER